jgi:hypothetical protein
MLMNGAMLLLIRSFGAALLMQGRKRYFVWYSAADVGFYLLHKILRGDFYHWTPVVGAGGFVTAVLTRTVVKLIVDYTGIVQFRASGEMGGAYWIFNVLLAVITPFVAVFFYYSSKPDKLVMTQESAWSIVGTLGGAWLFFFALFLKLMKKEYRKTFISFETGSDWAMSFFLKGDTDEKRVKPLRLNINKWKKIRPEMKEFLLDSWDTWEEENPKWFTEVWKSRVPGDMLPAAELRKQTIAGGGYRRKKSVLGEMISKQPLGGRATVVPETDEGVEGIGSVQHDGVLSVDLAEVVESNICSASSPSNNIN